MSDLWLVVAGALVGLAIGFMVGYLAGAADGLTKDKPANDPNKGGPDAASV